MRSFSFLINNAVFLLSHQEAKCNSQIVLGKGFLQTLRRLFCVSHLAKVTSLKQNIKKISSSRSNSYYILFKSYLVFQQITASHGIELLRRHLLGRLDTRHLLNNLLENQQVQALFGFKLIGHVLQ